MKKTCLLITLLSAVVLMGYNQLPFTIIHLDSTIFNVRDAIKLNNSEFIIVGNSKYIQGQSYKIFIAKIDAEGNILWKKEHPGRMAWNSSICAKSDGNYYIALRGDTTKAAILLETNQMGDSIWSFTSTEPETNNKYFGSVREFPGGKFVLSEAIQSNSYPFVVTESNYYILGSEGTVITKFATNNPEIWDIETISENEFVATEYSWKYGINKYNTDGQILNIDSCIEYPESDCILKKLFSMSDNKFFASGYLHMNNPESYGLISKIDADGQIEYCTSDSTLNEFLGIAQTDDGHIVYCGMKGDNKMIVGEMVSSETFIPRIEIVDYFDIFFGTTDILISNNYVFIFTEIYSGSSRSGMIKIPVDSIVSSIKKVNHGSLKIYPNPAKDFITITLPTPLSAHKAIYVQIIDVFGREVLRKPIVSDKAVFDLRGVGSGVYFYRLETESKIYCGKFMVQK